jgi:phage-related protein
VSSVVQAFPSEQELVLFVWTHPVDVSQVSVVQTLPSSQFGAAPPTQVPFAQVSPVVQALASLQATVLLVWTHPVNASQVSVVQTFPSSQFGAAPPTQVPLEHVSFVVQAFPSEQEFVLSV